MGMVLGISRGSPVLPKWCQLLPTVFLNMIWGLGTAKRTSDVDVAAGSPHLEPHTGNPTSGTLHMSKTPSRPFIHHLWCHLMLPSCPLPWPLHPHPVLLLVSPESPQSVPMMSMRCPHRVCTVSPRSPHSVPMMSLWCLQDTPRMSSQYPQDVPSVFPWCLHYISMLPHAFPSMSPLRLHSITRLSSRHPKNVPRMSLICPPVVPIMSPCCH